MRALVPTGRRRRREKRTGEKTRENMFSPEPLGSTPTHERHGRPVGTRARSARPACGGAKSHLRESGCERTGSRATWGRGEFSKRQVERRAQVEQARFDDARDRPCARGAVKHNGFGVGEVQRGVGRRRRARGDLVVSAGRQARLGGGGGWWVGCWSTCTRKCTWGAWEIVATRMETFRTCAQRRRRGGERGG